MPFGDVFAGWAKEATNHYNNLFQMDYNNKRSIAEQYAKMADDPRYDEETQAEARKRSLSILTLEPGKKLPKEYESFTFQRPPIAASIEQTQPGGMKPGENGSPLGMPAPDVPAPQGFQAPPQNMLQPMPFSEQMRRLNAQTIASTKFPPMKIDTVKSMDAEDGNIYDYTHYVGTNPKSGDYETWTIKSPEPVAYAPRAALGAILNVQDAQKLKEAGRKGFINNPTAQDYAAIDKIVPGARLIHTGYGEVYYVASPTYKPTTVGNEVVALPTNPPAGKPAQGAVELGEKQVPTTTNRPLPGLRTPGGEMPQVPITRTPETSGLNPGLTGAPAAAAPAAPPQGIAAPQASPAMPAAPPIQAVPGVTKSMVPPPPPAAPPTQVPPAQAAPAVKPQGRAPAPTSPLNAVPANTYDRVQKAVGGLNEIAKTMQTDPRNPDRDTLDRPEFAKMVADPRQRAALAKVFNILNELPKESGRDLPEFGLSLPGLLHLNNLGQYLSNKTGFTTETAKAKADLLQSALTDLQKTSPAGFRLLNTIQSMYTSMPGLRAINLGGAYQSAMQRLETDLPNMLNTAHLRDYENKLGQISRDISAATEQPDFQKIMEASPQWKGLIQDWSDRTNNYFRLSQLPDDNAVLAALGQSGGPGAPTAPPGAAAPKRNVFNPKTRKVEQQ